jgi:hypothetical protein
VHLLALLFNPLWYVQAVLEHNELIERLVSLEDNNSTLANTLAF